jgi:tetratricopeptide (TPR) repeat protein
MRGAVSCLRPRPDLPHAESLVLIGNRLADVGRYGDADENLTRAAAEFLALGRHVEYAQAMICRGRVLAEQGDEVAARDFYLSLLDLELPDVLTSQVYNNLGVLYRRANDLCRAADFLRRDIALCEKAADQRGAAIAHYNLAEVLIGRHLACD